MTRLMKAPPERFGVHSLDASNKTTFYCEDRKVNLQEKTAAETKVSAAVRLSLTFIRQVPRSSTRR